MSADKYVDFSFDENGQRLYVYMKEALEILQSKDLDQQKKTIKVYHENEIKQIQGAHTLMARCACSPKLH